MTIWWIWLIIGIATGWLSATGWWLWLTRPPKAGAHRIEGTGVTYEADRAHRADHHA